MVVSLLLLAACGGPTAPAASGPIDAQLASQWPGWSVYTDEQTGFSLNYPPGWQLQKDEQYQTVVFLPPVGSKEERIVAIVTDFIFEGALREEFIDDLTIAGAQQAQLLHDFSPKDGSPWNRLVVKLAEGKFVEVNGYGPTFDQLIKSFRLP